MEWRIIEREPKGYGKLAAKCKNHGSGECKWSLSPHPAADGNWQWNGNVEKPTITPSIDCQGGCNRHFTMVDGIPRGATN